MTELLREALMWLGFWASIIGGVVIIAWAALDGRRSTKLSARRTSRRLHREHRRSGRY